ncbi:MAG: tRNA (N6-threonylcarbamoyladenosine(37)-N6)-methyltransferase TrmO [Promethearchaeota archaeon]
MEITIREIYPFKERTFPDKICFEPIGIIHTPFKSLKGIPIQFSISKYEGEIEVFTKFTPALRDLDGFSHFYCLYYFDMVKLPVPLQSKLFLENDIKGVFAIRTPFRPNPIRLSILEVLEIKKYFNHIKNVDILIKTPRIDIKPYASLFDSVQSTKIGWLKGKIMKKTI